MPYYMTFKQNGKSWQWGPLQPDSYTEYGLDDRRIERKAKTLAKKLERAESDLKCEVKRGD